MPDPRQLEPEKPTPPDSHLLDAPPPPLVSDEDTLEVSFPPFDPDISAPPMDAPELEALRLTTDEVLRHDEPLAHYTRNEDIPDGEPLVLRDTPFGPQPGFGGETPFFTGPSSPAPTAYDTEDTDGFPTGLPDLLADTVPEAAVPLPPPAVPRAPTPRPAPVQAVTDTRELQRARREAEEGGQRLAAGTFVAGLFVASTIWATIAWLMLS